MFDEVADAIAAVQESAALAIDVAEARLARDDALETRGIRSMGLRVVGGRAHCGWRVGHGRMVVRTTETRRAIGPVVV